MRNLLTLPVDPVAKAQLVKRAIAFVAIALAVAIVVFYVRAVLGDKPAQEAAQGAVDKAVDNATDASHEFATGKLIERQSVDREFKEREIHYVETIRSAPGAADPVPVAVHDAGIAAIVGLRDAPGERPRDGTELPASRP